jgi:hypothetical protein
MITRQNIINGSDKLRRALVLGLLLIGASVLLIWTLEHTGIQECYLRALHHFDRYIAARR